MSFAVAVIADVHGNIWALDAVLEDLDRRGLHTIVNLGDHVYGPLAPAETAERLLKVDAVNIRGNQDRELLEPAPIGENPTWEYTKANLSAAHLEWLASHPATLSWEGMFLCHGSPRSDTEYLLEKVTAEGGVSRPVGELAAAVSESMILCGHTHVPRLMEANGRLILNPGSVGLQAYSDDLPMPHVMETGSPHARYAILEGDRVEFIALAYDRQSAAAAARANGRDDWAHALLTGRAH